MPGDPEHPTQTTVKLGGNDGWLLVGELNYAPEHQRYAAGVWRYTKTADDQLQVDEQGDPLKRRNQGWYVFGEWALPSHASDTRNIKLYARYGRATADINPLASYLGLGMTWTGAIPGRAQDQLGIALARATAGDPYRELQAQAALETARDERIIELTYQCVVNDWLSIQPDVQHTTHPGLDATLKSSLAVGLRVSMSWQW